MDPRVCVRMCVCGHGASVVMGALGILPFIMCSSKSMEMESYEMCEEGRNGGEIGKEKNGERNKMRRRSSRG